MSVNVPAALDSQLGCGAGRRQHTGAKTMVGVRVVDMMMVRWEVDRRGTYMSIYLVPAETCACLLEVL